MSESKKDDFAVKLWTVALIWFMVAFVGGWALMLLIGGLHAIWPAYPTVGYWAAVAYELATYLFVRTIAFAWKGWKTFVR